MVGIGLCYISTAKEAPHGDCNGPLKSELLAGGWSVRWLLPDEKYQIAMEDVIRATMKEPSNIQNANISIIVHFSPWKMPWREQKEFRFITKERSDGKIYRVPTPLYR